MRLIEADAVYKILESCEIEKATIGNPLTDWDHGYNCGIERAESEIECAPTVEAEPVRHGHWIEHPFSAVFEKVHSKDQIVCSCCEEAFNAFFNETERFKYCPNCGAKMDEVIE